MVGAMCIKVVDSSQEVCYPIHPAITSCSNLKPFFFNQPETYTFPLSAGVSHPYLPPAPNKATETVVFLRGKMFAPGFSSDQQWQQQQEAAAGKPQASRRQAAGKPQASSRQAAGKQQAASSKQQASSRQAASRQAGKQARRQAGKQQQPSSSNQAAATKQQQTKQQQPVYGPWNKT